MPLEFTLPHLAVVPTTALVPHEHADESRTHPLIRRIRESGVFRDPPIVVPFPQDPQRYMVLDGANRTTAARLMGLPHVLVQVVDPDAPGLELGSWNHVVWGLDQDIWLAGIKAAVGGNLLPTDCETGVRMLEAQEALVLLGTPDGRYFVAPRRTHDLAAWIQELSWVVESYIRRAHTDRTGLRRTEDLHHAYEHWTGVVLFPRFTVHQVLDVAWQGYKFPAGLTRFVVRPRALRVYYPLAELERPGTTEEKQARLQAWLQERLKAKTVRYYAEPTVLFDE